VKAVKLVVTVSTTVSDLLGGRGDTDDCHCWDGTECVDNENRSSSFRRWIKISIPDCQEEYVAEVE